MSLFRPVLRPEKVWYIRCFLWNRFWKSRTEESWIQVPLLKFLEENSNATAILIYPTKVCLQLYNYARISWYFFQALAQDQRTALEQLLCACPGLQHIKVATYDGDTPQDHRRSKPAAFCAWQLVISPAIRETASVIFTNFVRTRKQVSWSLLTMLSRTCCTPLFYLTRSFGGRELLCVFNLTLTLTYILSFIKNIKLVAVDELHYYSNLFGRWDLWVHHFIPVSWKLPSHVAQIIRRFRRICAAVGSMFQFASFMFLLTKSLSDQRVVFVSCSATISKPSQHMKRLFGVEVCSYASHCVSSESSCRT